MPNLIVIIFNLIYPVFYMGFICKGCVWERECEDSRQLKTKVVFAGSSRVSFLRSDACAQHMTGMRRVRTGWRQLVFTSITRIRHSRKIPAKHSILLNCHLTHTSVPTPYIPTLPTDVKECFWEKTLATNRWELEIVILTILYTLHCGFSSTHTFPFPYT